MRSWGMLAAVAMLASATGCATGAEGPTAWAGEPAALVRPTGDGLLSDVRRTDYGIEQHTQGPVEYAESPPMGGRHHHQPLVCGSYRDPVPAEHAVHSLEHGVVWVTYDPALVTDVEIRAVERVVPEKTIISPYDGLPAPVVVTVWNHQLALSGHDDAGLGAFLAEYGDGHTAPEPHVACTFGVTPGQVDPGTSV